MRELSWYRVLIFPIVAPLVYGGTLALKVGNFICWGKWQTVDIGDAEVF